MAVMFGVAGLVGIGTAVGGLAFIGLIALVERTLFISAPALVPLPGLSWLLLAPVIGGLLAGPIIAFFAREAQGHGVPEVMEAMALRGGRIRPRVALAKLLASAACIGSGGSAGREGPIVQVGAALGSTVGQLLRFSEERVRMLVAAGAAAGIAATFNAPIAGVIFAVEVVLGELRIGDLGGVVIASVIASVVARSVLGDGPAFAIPEYSLTSPWEILLYLLLGLLAAGLGLAFIRLLYAFEDAFDRTRFPLSLKPAVGGLLLGGLALALVSFVPAIGYGLPGGEISGSAGRQLPSIFGAGFATIEAGLNGELVFGTLLALAFLK
jgi:CIC family chloride channel protein